MGKLIIVSSVSGAGKTTLVDIAVDKFGLYKLKTCTTRPPRTEETGDEYYFYSVEEFIDNLENDEFFEHAEVYGNYYGLLNSEIDKHKDVNSIVILDVKGTKTAKELYPDAITIFIEPPSEEELEFRILKRNTSEEDASQRLAQIESEMKEMHKYDHIVKYDTLHNMTTQFNEIVKNSIS